MKSENELATALKNVEGRLPVARLSLLIEAPRYTALVHIMRRLGWRKRYLPIGGRGLSCYYKGDMKRIVLILYDPIGDSFRVEQADNDGPIPRRGRNLPEPRGPHDPWPKRRRRFRYRRISP